MQEFFRILATTDAREAHHMATCAARRADLMGAQRASWWDRATAWFRANLEMHRSLKRQLAAARERNEKLQSRLLRISHDSLR